MAQNRRDFYEVLEVSRTASQDEIKKAYRLKVRTCHPDTHPNDPDAEQKYKEVNEAYSVLGDPDKRSRYDQFGTADENPNPFGGANADDIFSDLFSAFGGGAFGGGFGGRQQRPDAPQRGDDQECIISISLQEAATGVNKKVTIRRKETCEHCHGTGAEPGYDIKECPKCHGTGQVHQQVRTIFGTSISVGVCPQCGGSGKIIEKPCKECKGAGRISQRRDQELKVPAGIDHGMRLRVPGQGDAGRNGGAPGDLYVTVEIRENHEFERDGLDLHKAVTIPFPLASLGGSATVSTLIDGDAEYTIPEGTQPGDTIRLRGRGMPRLRGAGRGDLYLHVDVAVPKASRMSSHGRALMEALAVEMGVKKPPETEPAPAPDFAVPPENVSKNNPSQESTESDESSSGIFGKLFGGSKKTKKTAQNAGSKKK